MANINNIRAGSKIPSSIMFKEYNAPKANSDLVFASLVPKDNSKIWNSVYGEWQVNDDWKIEILSPKKIAIKKFRIDTWGIRKIWYQGQDSTDTFVGGKDFAKFYLKVSGLDYVHNNVVYQEDENGNKVYGFAKAYCGNGGYNVYWYPGQASSGSFIQGLGVQSCIGYVANNNEVEDSFCMGKHPWDIGSVVNITDRVILGNGSDTSYKATCIGLWGGYQTATEWHEYNKEGYTGNAYKVWDISDNPIIIELDVIDRSFPIDPSTVECWRVYKNEELVYNKDKTRENCWRKYGISFPSNYSLLPNNLTLSNTSYIEWLSPTTMKISRIPKEGLLITKSSTFSNTESVSPSYHGFGIKVYNKPNNVNITFERLFTNVSNMPGGTPVNYNVNYNIVNGDNNIPAFSQKMFLINKNSDAVLTEFRLSIKDYAGLCNIIIELVPIFAEGDWESVKINGGWSMLSKLIIPDVIDKITNMTKTLWNSKPTNTEFWDDIKDWFDGNDTTPSMIQRGLFANSNIDEVRIRLNDYLDTDKTNPNGFLWANKPFNGSEIKKITIESRNGCSFSSANSLFYGTSKLETIEFVDNKDHSDEVPVRHAKEWLLGATDMSGTFAFCGASTYPPNLIRWNANRSNAFDNGIPCTLSGYAFDYAKITNIPVANNGDRYRDANTWIFTRYAQQAFNGANNLIYIGPILDLILVVPNVSSQSMFNCPNLVDVRIKNLNHGDWNFDGKSRNGVYHGRLANLNAESIQYMMDNLVDLNLYNPLVHENKIDKAFLSWSTSYANSWSTEFWESRVSTRYFESRKRFESLDVAQKIVYTTSTFANMKIIVSGLVEGDSLLFGDGTSENTTIISTNGIHTISKTTTSSQGFMLVGDVNNTDTVKVIIENGLDYTNPRSDTAVIYCPIEWADKLTAEMLEAAAAKKWHIAIEQEDGGEPQIINI